MTFTAHVKSYLKNIPRLFPLMLSGDLLYLYLVKAWHDPNKLIEYGELVSLFLMIGFSIAWFVKGVKECGKELQLHGKVKTRNGIFTLMV